MADRKPDLMQRKVSMRKVIDLSKMSMEKLRKLLSKEKNKKVRIGIRRSMHSKRTQHQEMLHKHKQLKQRRRRNEIARESKRRNRQ